MANKETTDESVTTKKPAASRAKPKAKAAPKTSAESGKPAAKKPAAKKPAAKAKKPAAKKAPAAKTSATKSATKAAKPKATKKAADKDDAKPKATRKKTAKKSSGESVTPESESTGEVVKAKKTPASKPDTATIEAKEATSAKGEEKKASAVEGDEQFDALPALPENFDEWDLAPPLRKALADMGYDRPMPVQQAVFQTLTAGKDLMVQSKTGSGKTAAFGIPISQLLSHEKKGVQALILAPTRELAMQVAKEIAKLVEHMDVSVVPIYGGTAINPQIEQLEAGAQIVAGTPGRVLDHIRRGTLKTSNIKMLTLDECDEMLSMGFQEEIENIIKTLPAKDKRQTLLFSATIPKEIERIGRRHMNEPVMISLSSDRVGADLIDHYYYVVSGMARTRDLLKIMKTEQPESAIIFCNTREETNTVSRSMRAAGYDAEALSSDLSQADRERVMGRMRDKNLQYLVATDIAARGIDISELSHVINYTFPNSPEIYVHRTGRTGRAGKQGTALSIVGPTEIGSFYYLKLIYKIDPKERELPGAEELATIQEGDRYQQVVDKVPAKARGEYLKLARRLWQSSQGERVVAVLLQELLSTKKPSAVAKPVQARSESPRSESPRSESPRSGTEDGERKRRRRRRHQEDEVADSDTIQAAASEDTAVSPEPKVSVEAEAKEAVPAEETVDSNEERPRRKRRRRRPGAYEEPPAPLAQASAPSDDTQTEPAVSTASETASETAPATPVTPASEDTRTSAVSDDVSTIATADAGEPDAAKEGTASPTEQAADVEVGDTVSDRPQRKRRRRRRGASAEEENESSNDNASAQEAVLATATATKPARARRARTTPGVHAEFWEAWADTKHTDPPEEDETHVFDASSSQAFPEPSKADEDDTKGRKKRRRGRRDSSDREESGPAESDTTPDTHPVRLFVNLGKREDANADDIRDFLAEALGESADGIGRITLRNTHSYVRATEEAAETVIDTCTGLTFRERSVVVERARR